MFTHRASRLYPIIDRTLCATRGLDSRALAMECLEGGARLLQLRAKTDSSAAFLALADDIVASAAGCGASIVVNDRADIAAMAGAAGVHVGQDDLSPEAARRIVGRAVVGLSTHDEPQVDAALSTEADYIAVGPIYHTGTKETRYSARGLQLVRYAANRGKPIVAIGGITLARAAGIIDAGASAVAVISDLLTTGNAEQRVREYLRTLA